MAKDVCTHRSRTLPGGTLTVSAHTSTARAVRAVSLPNARGLAVGVVTTAPVRAASPAVAVPVRPRAC
jgi:alkaline phosphatase